MRIATARREKRCRGNGRKNAATPRPPRCLLLLLVLSLFLLFGSPSAASDDDEDTPKKNHVLPFPLRPGAPPVEYSLPLGHVLSARIQVHGGAAACGRAVDNGQPLPVNR